MLRVQTDCGAHGLGLETPNTVVGGVNQTVTETEMINDHVPDCANSGNPLVAHIAVHGVNADCDQ